MLLLRQRRLWRPSLQPQRPLMKQLMLILVLPLPLASTLRQTMRQRVAKGQLSGRQQAMPQLETPPMGLLLMQGQPTGLKAGGVLGTKQFLDNPFEFAQMLDRQMEKHGIRGEQQKKEFIATIAPDRNTENMLTTFITPPSTAMISPLT